MWRVRDRWDARTWSAAAFAAALLATLSSCTAAGPRERPAQQSLNQYSQNAAIAMEKQGAYTTAADMARRVIGTGPDDTIAVLEASGTDMHGQVVLHIHVDEPARSEFDSPTHADACFRYSFRYTTVPVPIRCPHTAPITLPPPAPTTTTTEN
jgi:hypothetical protein